METHGVLPHVAAAVVRFLCPVYAGEDRRCFMYPTMSLKALVV